MDPPETIVHITGDQTIVKEYLNKLGNHPDSANKSTLTLNTNYGSMIIRCHHAFKTNSSADAIIIFPPGLLDSNYRSGWIVFHNYSKEISINMQNDEGILIPLVQILRKVHNKDDLTIAPSVDKPKIVEVIIYDHIFRHDTFSDIVTCADHEWLTKLVHDFDRHIKLFTAWHEYMGGTETVEQTVIHCFSNQYHEFYTSLVIMLTDSSTGWVYKRVPI
jgi:hypothetical protein